MLISLNSNKPVTRIPHRKQFDAWRSRLSRVEFDAICEELGRRVQEGEVHTSSWIPGGDWTGTVYQPIYDKACKRDPVAAGLCFGLILWHVMMQRPDKWSYGRYEKNGIPIEGLTYFRFDS